MKDLDFENRTISINHSVVYYPMDGAKKRRSVLQVSLPKTEAGIRVIPMMDAVYDAFQEEHEAQKENGFNCTEIDGMTGFVFCNRFGNVHNPQTVNRTIRRISENYNAEEVLKAKREKRQPIILQLAGAQIESTDRQACNALRLLKNFHQKLLRNNPIKPKH